MTFKLSQRSLDKLRGVHPALVLVVQRAIELSTVDFAVTEGVRSLARQRQLVAAGFSRTLDSKHLVQKDGCGHAVDVVAVGDLDKDGDIDAQDRAHAWDRVHYTAIAQAFRAAADEYDVGIRWGGEFKTRDGRPFFDGPHFELA